MKATIDKAGRIVVPKAMRDKYSLRAGTELELEAEADGIRIKPVRQEESLIQKNGILIHHGPEVVDLDIASFINTERAHRNEEIVAESPLE
ncbi:MAG: AbrB/MazE/SpoVT family DNA-binding domain-containing protein [Spirochaetaceae bacterium]